MSENSPGPGYEAPNMALGFDMVETLTPEQEIRLEVVKKLMDKGTRASSVEMEAATIVSYILDGPTPKPPPAPETLIKVPVFLPGQSERSDVNARFLDDGTINIEFWSGSDRKELERLISEERLVSLSFSYYPDRPVDTSKDN